MSAGDIDKTGWGTLTCRTAKCATPRRMESGEFFRSVVVVALPSGKVGISSEHAGSRRLREALTAMLEPTNRLSVWAFNS